MDSTKALSIEDMKGFALIIRRNECHYSFIIYCEPNAPIELIRELIRPIDLGSGIEIINVDKFINTLKVGELLPTSLGIVNNGNIIPFYISIPSDSHLIEFFNESDEVAEIIEIFIYPTAMNDEQLIHRIEVLNKKC